MKPITILTYIFLCLITTTISAYTFSDHITPNFSASYLQFINNDGTFLLSRNKTFKAAIFNPDSGTQKTSNFYLCIIHVSSSTITWSANRDSPISDSGRMNLTAKGITILDKDGNTKWSTPKLKSIVHKLALTEMGNLILLDQSNGSLWESFNYPTDTIVIGQRIPVGASLSSANYTLAITSSDAILQWHGQTYWKLSMETSVYKNSNNMVEYMAINRTGFYLFGNNDGTVPVYGVGLPLVNFRIAQLGSTGHFTISSFSSGTNWKQEFVGPGKGCQTPLACGRVGLCTDNTVSSTPVCSCPQNFHLGSGNNGCVPNNGSYSLPLACPSTDKESNSSSVVSFLRIGYGVGYFGNVYSDPIMYGVNLSVCQDLCSGNCSCLGVFYRNSSGSCYMVENELGSIQSSSNGGEGEDKLGFIKANVVSSTTTAKDDEQEASSQKDGFPVAAAVLSPIAVLVLIMALVFFLVRRRLKPSKTMQEVKLGKQFSQHSSGDLDAFYIPGLPRRFDYEELEEATDNFKTLIGSGAFGAVYKGVMPEKTVVAVKKIVNIGIQGKKDFCTEIAIIGNIHHVNLVRLRGFCAQGGHASCLVDTTKLPEDVWGGDAYSWASLQNPFSFGSRGGSTSKESDYGGLGGGLVRMTVHEVIEMNASVLADGGDGGTKGGGGSGGSVYIKGYRMTGSGMISACGGNGFAGGGGGRVSVDVFSRHDEPKIYVHGGSSFACPENAGAAGTLYDAVPRSLIVDNYNMTTDTETLLLDFPNQPLWTNVYVRNKARATVPLLWSRVQVQGQISILQGGVLSFGLPHYATSEFELLAEELLMSDSVMKVYGALRMSVKMFLMWNSKMLIDGGEDITVATSLLEASNLIVLRGSSVIHSNANLGVHGQGLLNLSGPGDWIEAQRLVLSLFYSIHVGPGSVLRGPLENATTDDVTPKLYCDNKDCPYELLHPPEDCNVNSSLSFTLQICRVEDVLVEGLIKGSVVNFHRARTIAVESSGMISASGTGCTGGLGRGNILSNGIGSGGGHGGKGGDACSNDYCVDGGTSYGTPDLPCELGSGSGNGSSTGATAGGGIIVIGSLEHPLSSLSIQGSVNADGESFDPAVRKEKFAIFDNFTGGPGGGSGGTILLFLHTLDIGESAILSSMGGYSSISGGGGGGGGRIHFHWSDIPTGDVYQPIASVEGDIQTGGGKGKGLGGSGTNGTVTGKACPKGLYGTFCEECPAGTYKNVTGSDRSLCQVCPVHELPHRAVYISVRGGITETPCPYQCISDRYHMPDCYTALEELIYTFGGPWLFGLFLTGLLILLALVLSVARMKFVGVDELPGPAPTQHGSQIDHSFPFLESLNEVLETNRVEESQSHVHRMYFMGPNTFSDPWHLPHTPSEQIQDIVYESAFNTFVDEINAIAAYQWWEGAIYSVLSVLAYPLAWSWQQWRRRLKLQRLREFVRSEYDHACLRSCRSRALYEGIKVNATSDLMLAYVDFFLGGDEKRTDLPPRLHERFPMTLLFGGDGSYMAPFTLHNDNILTSLMSQSVQPTTWYRLVAGLNAQLRLVRRGRLRVTFRPVLRWLETHANPALSIHGVRVDLAWFQAISIGYCHYGLVVYALEEGYPASGGSIDGALRTEERSRVRNVKTEHPLGLASRALLSPAGRIEDNHTRRKMHGAALDINNLQMLDEKRDIFYLLSFILQNTKPVGHQDLVGLVISMLLLGDFSLVLLTLLQLYSISLVDVFLVLFILPFGILLPFPVGINALFSHGPRRSAGLARLYALWNLTSFLNVVVAFLCGYIHYNSQSSSSNRHPSIQPWNIMDENEWWIFPTGLVLCKLFQSQLINWHVANLEIQDRSLYSNDFELFWQS